MLFYQVWKSGVSKIWLTEPCDLACDAAWGFLTGPTYCTQWPQLCLWHAKTVWSMLGAACKAGASYAVHMLPMVYILTSHVCPGLAPCALCSMHASSNIMRCMEHLPHGASMHFMHVVPTWGQPWILVPITSLWAQSSPVGLDELPDKFDAPELYNPAFNYLYSEIIPIWKLLGFLCMLILLLKSSDSLF